MSTFISEFSSICWSDFKCQFETKTGHQPAFRGLAHGCLWLVAFGHPAHGLGALLNAGVVAALGCPCGHPSSICVLYLPAISCPR